MTGPCYFRADPASHKPNLIPNLYLKIAETFDSAKSAAEKSNLEKVKSEIEEGKKLLIKQQILLADNSEYGWIVVE